MNNQPFTNYYQLKDPATGKVVTVSGDTPPSQAQIETIFARAGLHPQQAQPQNTGIDPDTKNQLAGAVGGTIGQLGGTLLDPVTAGLGTEAGGALGGGVAQGLASLLQGQGLGNAASNFGQGAAFGAIPGGDESKALGLLGEGFAKKELMRGATGAVGGSVSQALQNIQKGQSPLQANVLEAGAGSGAANAVIPGVTSLLGKAMGKIPPEVWERVVGGPLQAQQDMFDKTASSAVGDYNKDYALSKGIIPGAKDELGKLQPEGLMDKDYIDSAISKRKQVAQGVEAQIQKLLPDKPITSNEPELARILSTFKSGMYGGSAAKNNAAFLADIQNLAQKTATSDEIPTRQLRNFLRGPGSRLLGQEGKGTLATVNYLKRIVGRGYNEQKPGMWEGLYKQLQSYVEKNSTNPEKVASLNQEHAMLINMRKSLSKFKKGAGFPFLGSKPAQAIEHARFGKTIGLSAERGMSVPLLIPQAISALGGGVLGYKLGQQTGAGGTLGGVTGAAVAPYLLAGSMREIMERLFQNPDVQESVAKLVQKGMPPATAVSTLLQQLGIRRPVQSTQ